MYFSLKCGCSPLLTLTICFLLWSIQSCDHCPKRLSVKWILLQKFESQARTRNCWSRAGPWLFVKLLESGEESTAAFAAAQICRVLESVWLGVFVFQSEHSSGAGPCVLALDLQHIRAGGWVDGRSTGCVNIMRERLGLDSFSTEVFKLHWECLHNCSKEACSLYLFTLFTSEIL